MNKFGKILSMALAAAVSVSSVCFPVLANNVEDADINSEVSVAAMENFSIEKYPYSYVKTLDDENQIKDHIVYNESSKFRNLLSTQTSNPGFGFGPGYKGDAMILTLYSGHRNRSYGGDEKESSYGNAAQIDFTTKAETVYSNPTTGGQIALNLSEATRGTNKLAFWTKAEKTDTTDRVAPETISYSLSPRGGITGSSVTVKIPADGQWHYVVADLEVPYGEGFAGFNFGCGNTNAFGNVNGGAPYLKLDGKEGFYPVDDQNRYIEDIPEAYVLVDGEYKKTKLFNVTYKEDPYGAYVNIPNGEGNPVYYRTDNVIYLKTLDANGGITYVEDTENGDLIFDIKSGQYISAPNAQEIMATRYTVDLDAIESYLVDDAGEKLLDEAGNPIPQKICGNLVKEIWTTQVYIDDMLFYRTTESGGRTTFMASGEEDVAYGSNTELSQVLVDGVPVYDVELDGDNRVLTLPKDLKLDDPEAAKRIEVVTKTPDVILEANKDGGAFIPVDISETGAIRSGSVGTVTLPATDKGIAKVSVISSLGAIEDYSFTIQRGYDLSIIGTKGTDKFTAGRKTFTIQNYSETEDKTVQIMAVVKDKTTNELKTVTLSNIANGTIPAGGSKDVYLNVSLTGIDKEDYANHMIYFYFYDSVTSMNQVVSTYVMKSN